MRGTIISILSSRDKGYCFIRGDDDNISRFGHARAFSDPLAFDTAREGQAVEFRAIIHHASIEKAGGTRAIDIVLLPAGYAVEKV
jgi:cold shock CspA family protein